MGAGRAPPLPAGGMVEVQGGLQPPGATCEVGGPPSLLPPITAPHLGDPGGTAGHTFKFKGIPRTKKIKFKMFHKMHEPCQKPKLG